MGKSSYDHECRIAELEKRLAFLEEIVRYATNSSSWPMSVGVWGMNEPPQRREPYRPAITTGMSENGIG